MSSSVLYAAKRAIESARHDMGNDQPFELCKFSFTFSFILSCFYLFYIAAPATVENIQQACLVDISKFVF